MLPRYFSSLSLVRITEVRRRTLGEPKVALKAVPMPPTLCAKGPLDLRPIRNGGDELWQTSYRNWSSEPARSRCPPANFGSSVRALRTATRTSRTSESHARWLPKQIERSKPSRSDGLALGRRSPQQGRRRPITHRPGRDRTSRGRERPPTIQPRDRNHRNLCEGQGAAVQIAGWPHPPIAQGCARRSPSFGWHFPEHAGQDRREPASASGG